jgi:hypothetical protein
MSYDNPAHREMMDLEGLKAWVPGRTSRYGLLQEAVEQQQFFSRIANLTKEPHNGLLFSFFWVQKGVKISRLPPQYAT